MREPRWLSIELIKTIHAQSLATFGGASGLRDTSLLERAVAWPRNLWSYHPDASIFELAASLGYGLIRNHAFVDGNKRTGLLAINAFLHLNGYRFDPAQMDEVKTILALAAGEMEEAELAEWQKANSQPRCG
jgi:death-on-curing protein